MEEGERHSKREGDKVEGQRVREAERETEQESEIGRERQ